MPGKTTFGAGFAAGYVLGARAGRQRYEQIRRGFESVKHNPKVSQAADKVQAEASGLVGSVKETVKDKAGAKLSRHRDTPDTTSVDLTDTAQVGTGWPGAATNGRTTP